MSETSRIRDIAKQFCHGRGLDLGTGGDKLIKNDSCIGVDMENPYNILGDDKIDVICDARTLPFDDNEFDYVYSSHLLEDFPNTESVLEEWLRVLRPGGNLVLYLPNEQRYRLQLEMEGKTDMYNKAHSIMEMSLAYIRRVLLKFCVKEIFSIDNHNNYSFFIACEKE